MRQARLMFLITMAFSVFCILQSVLMKEYQALGIHIAVLLIASYMVQLITNKFL